MTEEINGGLNPCPGGIPWAKRVPGLEPGEYVAASFENFHTLRGEGGTLGAVTWWCDGDLWVSAACLAWIHSEPKQETGGAMIGDGLGDRFSLLFKTVGPSGSLREPRHTSFHNDGYVCYVQPKLIAAAFDFMRRWWDFD